MTGVRAKATELVKGAVDEDAKILAIYNCVSTQYRDIGIAFDLGRFPPHSATEVLSNQYGDCKDKHTLLASLLQAAGVTAHPALISSGKKVDFDVPSISLFNPMITVLPGGKSKVADVKFVSGPEKLRTADKTLAATAFSVPVPTGSDARLLRRGILGCYPATGCALVMLVPSLVQSIY